MCGEIIGWQESLVFNPYGDAWRSGRKLFHQYLGGRGQVSTAISKFGHIQERVTHATLVRIMRDPENVEEHIRQCVSSPGLLGCTDIDIAPQERWRGHSRSHIWI